jgi:hypothetical protein
MLASREAAVISAKTSGRDFRRAKSSLISFGVPRIQPKDPPRRVPSITYFSEKNIVLPIV